MLVVDANVAAFLTVASHDATSSLELQELIYTQPCHKLRFYPTRI